MKSSKDDATSLWSLIFLLECIIIIIIIVMIMIIIIVIIIRNYWETPSSSSWAHAHEQYRVGLFILVIMASLGSHEYGAPLIR